MKEPTQHIIDSGSSYLGGGMLIFGTPLVDVASVAQVLGLVLGVMAITVKLIYDTLKLKRDFLDKKGR